MNCVYPFGVDPAWALSPQLLTFTNNIKMKLSVIIGVIHMTIGIFVKGQNSVFFGRYLDLIFEVFTGIIILLGLFGWMDFLIFSKWTYTMNPYSIDPAMIDKITYAPSIITVMINNFLAKGNPGANQDGVQQYFVPDQKAISLILVLVVLVCVPLMLCVKPLILIYCTPHHPNEGAEFDRVEPVDDEGQPLARPSLGNNAEDGKADIKTYEDLLNQEAAKDGAHSGGEIFIHQMIETIEFVLGTVSNTASYLRLWALSLAHSQLAGVFLENGLVLAWRTKDGP